MTDTKMDECRHLKLVLIKPETDKLRCRRCNLTISRKDLEGDFCPECLEARGERHNDFEPFTPEGATGVQYRCETCGMIIRCDD